MQIPGMEVHREYTKSHTTNKRKKKDENNKNKRKHLSCPLGMSTCDSNNHTRYTRTFAMKYVVPGTG